jgi:hypothetical protein
VRRRVLLLAVIGALLALGASSAVAQPQVVTATGVLETAPPYSPDPTPTYAITDEATSARYDLISGFVDLAPYVGQRVSIRGEPVPGPGDPNRPPLLNVTEVVPLGAGAGGGQMPATGGPSLLLLSIGALAMGSGVLVVAGPAVLRRSRQ